MAAFFLSLHKTLVAGFGFVIVLIVLISGQFIRFDPTWWLFFRRWLHQRPYDTIGIGMWLALIMACNVWFIIWPSQKKVLGPVAASADEKAAAAHLSGLTSRANLMLSIPMLYCMVAQNNAGL